MRPRRLILRSLRYHWRGHLAVALGVVVGTATLTGALLAGDSMRASLRDAALSRLGPVEYAMVAPRYFREALATELAAPGGAPAALPPRIPMIAATAGIRHARTAVRVNHINLYGVDQRFWSLDSASHHADGEGTGIILNRGLADELGVQVGDEVLLNLAKPQTVPVDTLLGRRDEMTLSVRRTVDSILPDTGMADLSLKPTQRVPRNAFLPLRQLQQVLKQPDRVNVLLLAGPLAGIRNPHESLQAACRRAIHAEDCGLRVLANAASGSIVVESDQALINAPAARAIVTSAAGIGRIIGVLTYLVNDVSIDRETAQPQSLTGGVPYSVGSAIDDNTDLTLMDGSAAPPLGDEELFLNEWAAEDLGAKPGDRIRMTYYVSRPGRPLETDHAVLTLKGIVRMTGLAADAGLTPSYEGITDAKRMGDWDPPFPLDLKRIRPKDEQYWDRHKATPKLFVSLRTGTRLWADPRYGQMTSVRITPPGGGNLNQAREAYTQRLRAALAPEDFGLTFRAVRAEALNAADGNTDFGMLFVSFSFFLIAAAALLVAILFRLNIERRAPEIGLLLAVGFARRRITRLLLGEGLLLGVFAAGVGLPVAAGYAWLMLAGLRSWWSQAAHAPFLTLHILPSTLAIGGAVSILVLIVSIGWAIRGMTGESPRGLLAGAIRAEGYRPAVRGRRIAGAVLLSSLVCGIAALSLSLANGAHSNPAGFFGAGAALLTACLAWLYRILSPADSRRPILPGGLSTTRLGLRNAGLHRGRSLLTAGLIASACFVIVSVGANRHAVDADDLGPTGGAGGYALIGESVVPLGYDVSRPESWGPLNLSDESRALLRGATIAAFRVRPGDDTSCLNLYQARQPRILGAGDAFIQRGGFAFSDSLALSAEERANPWLLLRRTFPDGAIPCIGDANSITWLLHLGLGRDFLTSDETGRPLRLRIVGMLSGSVLQGELLIAEARFITAFPTIAGYSALLIAAPPDSCAPLRKSLESDLTDYGLDLQSTRQRLTEYLAVENTYLSAFGTLGGLGLLLGTVGLAAVMLRNVVERRGELALLLALGWRPAAVGWVVFSENAALLIAGLFAGAAPALVAVLPHLMSSGAPVPWGGLGVNVGAVLLTGLFMIRLALRPSLRAAVIPALRSE